MQISSDNARINVRVDGSDRRAIVLLHGFPFSHELWDLQVPALVPHARVVCPDLRGCGRSSSPPGPYLMESLAGDIAAVMDGLGIASATIAGHSMGGYVALAFARMYAERVDALALVCSSLAADSVEMREWRNAMAQALERTKDIAPVVDSFSGRLFSAQTRERTPAVVERARSLMAAIDPVGAAALLRGMALRDPAYDIAGDLTMPVMIVAGAQDPLSPPGRLEETAGAFPHADVRVLEDSDHLPMLEQPGEVSRSLADLVERVLT